MKLNKFFMLGLAGLAFAACSSEDEATEGLMKGNKQIAVTIQAGDYAGTRAGSGWTDKPSEGTIINAQSIKVYLLDQSGKIIQTEDAQVGENIYQNISPTVTQIAATANCTPATQGTWDNILATELEISSYGPASGAPLCSEKAILVPDGNTDQTGDMVYKASVSLKTMLSRFELKGNLTCSNLGVDAYSKLTLKNIGLNGVYPKFKLSGDVAGNKLKDTSNQTGYPVTVSECFYDEVQNVVVADQQPTALVTGFGYNSIGKPDEFLLEFDTEFKNPITEGFVVYNPAYLKIVDYKTTEGVKVTIEPGKIYQITDLEFTEEDLTDLDPDEPTISVTATVSVVDWDLVDVEPEYGGKN